MIGKNEKFRCSPSVVAAEKLSTVTDISVARSEDGKQTGFWIHTGCSSTYVSKELINKLLEMME